MPRQHRSRWIWQRARQLASVSTGMTFMLQQVVELNRSIGAPDLSQTKELHRAVSKATSTIQSLRGNGCMDAQRIDLLGAKLKKFAGVLLQAQNVLLERGIWPHRMLDREAMG
jgi:hypothetical protein